MEEIVSNPGKYILQNSIENISLIESFSEGSYCYSNGEPLGDYDPRYKPFIQTIKKIILNSETLVPVVMQIKKI